MEYGNLIALLKNEPTKLSQYKSLFTECLDNHLQQLIDCKHYEQTFACFQETLDIFGKEDPDILNVLGVSLNRLEKPVEALGYLALAAKLSPDNLVIFLNHNNLINLWVPRWHFTMLNDTERNDAYRRAICKKAAKGIYNTVLDIGTGTGLLSWYCHLAGIKKLYACETNELMINIAEKIFQKNHIPVNLLHMHSTDIELKEIGMNENFDLVVTEIFDSGAFGEHVLTTLIHAKDHLLKNPNGHIIPEKIKMFVVGVNKIRSKENVRNIHNFENAMYLNDIALTSIVTEDEPYKPFEQIGSEMISVTERELGITVDFNDIISLRNAENGNLDCNILLHCLRNDFIEGFCVYFELYLDDSEILTNWNSNADRTKFKCWDPIVFPISHPKNIISNEILNVRLSCKHGVLKLSHDYDTMSGKFIEVDKEIIAFLSDHKFLNDLELRVVEATQNQKIEIFGDFLVFPHIGLNLLFQNKITVLYCLQSNHDILKQINFPLLSSIVFIEDFEYFVENSNISFDLILLQPLTIHGDLNQAQLKYYEILKDNFLNENGILWPDRITITCKLIHSEWLQNVCRCNNRELREIGIEDEINQYSTSHQYEYIDFDTQDLSDPFSFNIQLNEKLSRTNCIVNLKTIACNKGNTVQTNKIDGIQYFYNIFTTENLKPISMNNENSFCKSNCFVQNFDIVNRNNVTINFIQNELIFFCKINLDDN